MKHPLGPGDWRVTQRFGENPEYYAAFGFAGHEGLDFACPEGTIVYAAHDGQVVHLPYIAGYGRYLRVENAQYQTTYSHLSSYIAAHGQFVAAGEPIARSGSTGTVTGPHLHFGVRPKPTAWDNGYQGYVDPQPYIERGEIMSKLGVHYQGPAELGTEATELVRNSRIQYVKAIDPDNWHAPASEMFPRQRVVARLWIGGDALEGNYMYRGVEGAEAYFALLKQRYMRLKAHGVWGVLGPNEPHPWTIDELNRHAAFWKRWAALVGPMGLRPFILSAGVGWPDYSQVPTYCEAVTVAMGFDGGVELHEYGAPSVMDGGGHWTLRYRKFVQLLGLRPPIIIGECGIDGGVIPWSQGEWASKRPRKGWQDWKDWVYPPQYGLPQSVMDEERYWRQLSAYDDELCKDDYVLTATPFVTCPNSDWATFDVPGSLIRRIAAKHEAQAAPEPQPYLPSTDPLTQAAVQSGSVGQMADKVRWWQEEAVRQLERGQDALPIMRDMVSRDNGLLYMLERRAKELGL